jgi:hypothetical protein
LHAGAITQLALNQRLNKMKPGKHSLNYGEKNAVSRAIYIVKKSLSLLEFGASLELGSWLLQFYSLCVFAPLRLRRFHFTF